MENLNKPVAERLEGLTLEGGWKVGPLLERGEQDTGGFFSKGYIVTLNGTEKAFLKALDIADAMAKIDPARALEALLRAFNFERDLLALCEERKLSKIIRAIAHGKIEIPPGGGFNTVQYIIFELAKGGDIRRQIAQLRTFDQAWAFRTLHQIAVGLWQLHSMGVAHQDVKPSNVLFVEAGSLKLGDLGRASLRGTPSPADAFEVVGDRTYAPPDLLYHQGAMDWNHRRLACDLYLLGSMAVFLFTGHSMTGLTQSYLDPSHRCDAWSGTYSAVLPYVRAAFNEAVANFSKKLTLDTELVERLTLAVRRLCDPEPEHRGHPSDLSGKGNKHSLERFISDFNLIATRYENRFSKSPLP